MLLEDAGVQKRTINALAKQKLYTVNDVACYFPRKYLDYRYIIPLSDAVGRDCAVSGYLECYEKKASNGRTIIAAEVMESSSGEKIHVKWFGQSWQLEGVKKFARRKIVICGKVTYHPVYGYCLNNPHSYHLSENFQGKIIPIYRKIKNVGDDMLKKTIDLCIHLSDDPLEQVILEKAKLPTYKEALQIIHHPCGSEKEVEMIQKPAWNRIVFNDMLYFTMRLKLNTGKYIDKSPFIAEKAVMTKQFISMLPFELTKDQLNIFYRIRKMLATGRRVNMLIQGDVGCGKTMVAFLSMFLMAENGYQGVIMAPTTVLAGQHYEELKAYAEKFGFQAALLTKELKGAERKKVLSGIKDGSIHFIVGTHSVFSKDVEYKNLALAITDEEHRFGVLQREALEGKASQGVHVISMSATPIPRSLADVIYGEQKEIAAIKSMPGGRKPVQTAINQSDDRIFAFLSKQLKMGRQAYVVCPMIDEDESDAGLESVETAEMKYKEFFEPYGVNVGTVTGQMVKEEIDKELSRFRENFYQILISTTVIEVGINVPNASVIVINNAERFGLAQLHQLRGRVGRGSYQSYCILKSKDRMNERLVTMTKTTDGFEIAQADLKLRGVGDLIGTAQSGSNHFMDLLIEMPRLYECVKKYAEWIMDADLARKLIAMYEEVSEL